MDAFEKANRLGQAAQYDICATCGADASRRRDDLGRWIYPASVPDGRKVQLFKVLLSNACERDCNYCVNRASRDGERVTFKTGELAASFMELVRRGAATGLFLSSAVCGSPDQTMERMIAEVEVVRKKYDFRGYVHLKILPGVQRAAVERAAQLAQRVSVNLEAPNPARLLQLSGNKRFEEELLTRMRWARTAIMEQGAPYVTQTTQFVVGAVGEADREILVTTSRLYRELRLARAYFSAFQPVSRTPLENLPATPPLREHRLYQSDFLMRSYGFAYDELIFDPQGNLPHEADPKMMWARRHPEWFPLEVNRADKEALLRVPGIGPRTAERILQLRGRHTFRDLTELKHLGVVPARIAPFVLLAGKRPPVQLPLWEDS